MHSLRTGRLAAEQVQPGGFWGYLAQQPEARAIFNVAMAGKAQAHLGSILAAYDFSTFGSIADIGGGRGHLLRAILDAVPSACGVLFDLPPVIEEVGGVPSERLRLEGGDFFKDALPDCDGYLLMEVIHGWDDRDALAILRAVRRAAPAHARLLVIEQMIPDDPGPHWAKMLDLHMLALLGGRQRSAAQYTALLEQAGFIFQRQIDTCADIAILEATPTRG